MTLVFFRWQNYKYFSIEQKPVFLQRKYDFKLKNKKNEPGKLTTWVQSKVQALKDWYNKEENVLRRVRFPGTKLPFLDVVIDFVKLFTKGRTVDRAAGVAFNFFLALFPLILFFFTLIPYIPIPYLYERVMMVLDDFLLPSGTLDYVKETIDVIMNQPHDGLLSLSIILCLVFGSSGIVAIFNGFRNVYANFLSDKGLGLKGWITQRLFAIIMLIVLGALMVISVLLIALGGRALHYLVVNEILEGGTFTFFLFNVLRWVVGIFALSFGIALLYYFGNVKFDEHYRVERKRTDPQGQKLYRNFVVFSPGTILATTLFVLSTEAFNIYISNFSSYNVLYGSIGTLIILMLWIWIIAVLILAGNDLNSGIRRQTDRLSASESANSRREIVIEDLKKHIKSYQATNEFYQQRIEALRKKIEEQNVMIQDLEEEIKNNKLIIKAYEEYVEMERKRSEEQYSNFES